MSKRILVSIIIPVYKAEKTIQRCVNSLLSQTYSNLEIILVENGDTSIYQKINFEFQKINLINIYFSNKGVSQARNVGLRHAHGDYIAFCDADDYYSEEFIDTCLCNALSLHTDVLITGYYLQNKDRTFNTVVLPKSKFMSLNDIVEHIMVDNYVMGVCWNKFFKKSVINDNLFPNNMSVLEDTYFLFEVLQHASKIYYLAKPLYYYCFNTDSVVRNVNMLFSEDGHHYLYLYSLHKILQDFKFNLKNQMMINARIFEFAVDVKHFVVHHKKYYSSALLDNLNQDITANMSAFFKSKKYTFKHKLRLLILMLFPHI